MLVTDRFVFVHIPKTGGTFVQKVIAEHMSVVDHQALLPAPSWSHTPYDELPAEWRALPAFCVIRNPWDWYVSWFHYQGERGPRRRATGDDRWGKRAVWDGPMRGGDADFREAVTRACTGDFDHPLLEVMSEQGLDLYSARVREIAAAAFDRPNFTVLRFERLRVELVRFLETHADPPPALIAAIRERPRERVSERGSYQGYYDEELRRLVAERTAWICERFGYRFD